MAKRGTTEYKAKAAANSAKWRAKNVERVRATEIAKRIRNKANGTQQKWDHDRRLRNLPLFMCSNAKKRAKDKGLPFELDWRQITIPDFCPVLGTRMVAGDMANRGNAPSLDRVVPELGYVHSNVEVISFRANQLKNNATVEELERVLSYMRRAHR